jgi:protein-S-isoprenylcysteine O-methyltransferase Ste14
MLFFVGVPLLLGSWRGVAMAPLFLVLFAVRTRIEERALIKDLPGYADYAATPPVPGFTTTLLLPLHSRVTRMEA